MTLSREKVCAVITKSVCVLQSRFWISDIVLCCCTNESIKLYSSLEYWYFINIFCVITDKSTGESVTHSADDKISKSVTSLNNPRVNY